MNPAALPHLGPLRLPESSPLSALLRRLGLAVALILVAVLLLWVTRDGIRDHAHGGRPLGFVDTLYFAVVSLTTLGYGDISPVTTEARLINTFLLTPIRIFLWVLFLGTAYELTILRLQLRENREMRELHDRLDRHVMHSTTKSFVSALTGIAIDHGYVRDVDVLYYDLFTYGGYDNWSLAKAGMTLEDALTMRFGFAWDEWSVPYGQPGNSLWDLFQDYVDVSKGLLDQPVITTPGTAFVYNTAGTISIGQALENVAGVPLENFADQYLFAPLQIQDVDWTETPTGLPNGGSGLFLTTREMLKFGQLYLDGGVWHGERVISEEWVMQSTQPHADYSDAVTSGYGYQWWIDRFLVDGEVIESYSTRGFGGQNIFVVPSLRLVVALTGRSYGPAGANAPYRLMQDYLLPAMQ